MDRLAYLTVEGICEWYHLLISNIAMCLVIFPERFPSTASQTNTQRLRSGP